MGELPLVISELTWLEFNSATSKYVRTGTITKEQARQVIDAFERQCDKGFIVLPVESMDFRTARNFIAGLNTSLKTFDALHLAMARTHECLLVTADKQLAAAATMLDIEHYFVPYS